MAIKLNILSARQIDSLKAGFHADGGNLYLRVKESGARSWVFRFKAAAKVRELGLGSSNSVSLARAREIAGLMRAAVADGADPADVLKKADARRAKTFSDYAAELVEAKRAGWKNAKHTAQWLSTLTQYASPLIGNKLPANVTLADVKAILEEIWTTKTETASRLRQRIEAVLDYAAVHEGAHGRYNPARWKGNLDHLLPAATKVTKRIHHAAAPHEDMRKIYRALCEKDSMSALCLRFTILTAARSGEARGARWHEINLEAKTWLVPAERMKAGKPHRVALCNEAVGILLKLRQLQPEPDDYVFSAVRGGPLSDVALSKTLKSIYPGITVHGFRSSFRTWVAERTNYPSAVAEEALAHTNKNEVEAAYQRSDLFEQRFQMMADWEGHILAPESKSPPQPEPGSNFQRAVAGEWLPDYTELLRQHYPDTFPELQEGAKKRRVRSAQ